MHDLAVAHRGHAIPNNYDSLHHKPMLLHSNSFLSDTGLAAPQTSTGSRALPMPRLQAALPSCLPHSLFS